MTTPSTPDNDPISPTGKPISVAALTGGKNVPSARFRVRALAPELSLRGVEVNEYIPAITKYPPTNRWLRAVWFPAALGARLPGITATHRHDITLLQRELISTLYTIEGLTRAPRVLDVDDAIFLRRNGKPARRLAESSVLVLAGNQFLADWFSQWQSNIELLPTSIDTSRFRPWASTAESAQAKPGVTIGWTGSQTNLRYLELIEPALKQVLQARPDTQLHIVCDRAPALTSLPPDQLRFTAWMANREVEDVQGFDIGIMPLVDGDWERGKCAFKALQYMACEKPVVASPVGVNAELLADERIGFAASNNALWESSLIALIDDMQLRRRLGQAGRALAQARYDTSVIAERMADALRGAL